MTTVQITKLTEPAELFHHYPRQTEPQPCVLVLDLEDGELTARYDPHIGGGSTPDVHYGVKQWITIPCLTAEYANSLLREVAPIAQRILDGATVEYDDNGNKRGILNADADAALEELADQCDRENFAPQETVAGWSASDWFSDGAENTIDDLGITADTTDAELEEKAAGQVETARTIGEAGYNVLDMEDTVTYLTELRDELRKAVREEVPEIVEKIDDLKTKRDKAIVRIKSWGDAQDTLRSLGELADVSHTEIGRILAEAQQAMIDRVTGFTVDMVRPDDSNEPTSGWNYAEAATAAWMTAAVETGLSPKVVSTAVEHPEREAAVVEVGGVHYVLDVSNDVVRALEHDTEPAAARG